MFWKYFEEIMKKDGNGLNVFNPKCVYIIRGQKFRNLTSKDEGPK